MSRKRISPARADAGAPGAAGCSEKLSPTVQWRNPVMFIVWIGSLITTLLAVAMASRHLASAALPPP